MAKCQGYFQKYSKIYAMVISIVLSFGVKISMAFTLSSSAFKHQEMIPSLYTCDGQNISPPLTWMEPPKETKSFALIMDDPDAPSGTWDHWIVYNIPNNLSALSEDLSERESILFGKNSWGKTAYGGPCPPSGIHRYIFTLYALDTPLADTGLDKKQLLEIIKKHILGKAQLIGRYTKK